jgi:hypothetical protein
MGLNTCIRRICLYTGENREAGRGGVAPNRCKMGHSELQKIDQTVKKRSKIRGTVARKLNFLVIEIQHMCTQTLTEITKSYKCHFKLVIYFF